MFKLSAYATSPPRSENREEPLDARHPDGGSDIWLAILYPGRIIAPGKMVEDQGARQSDGGPDHWPDNPPPQNLTKDQRARQSGGE
jgi:hypothetical protein